MKQDKDPLKALHRILSKREFKNEDELKEFMDSILLKPIPEIPDEKLSNEEKAQDLVEEAEGLPIRDAIKNIDVALNLDPDCIEAYEFMGSIQRRIDSALTYYKKGVDIGRRTLGGSYLKKNLGHFWRLHETRAYMRCMNKYADCLYASGNKDECISVQEEMILLNPTDNQGIRDFLMLYLLERNDFEKFEKYSKLHPDDLAAYYFFNKALYSFKKEGASEDSNALLIEAIEENNFILPMIVSSKVQTGIPDTYALGSKDEAKYYAVFAQKIWQQTPGAISWLMKFRNVK